LLLPLKRSFPPCTTPIHNLILFVYRVTLLQLTFHCTIKTFGTCLQIKTYPIPIQPDRRHIRPQIHNLALPQTWVSYFHETDTGEYSDPTVF
jgi:hypothetical protein